MLARLDNDFLLGGSSLVDRLQRLEELAVELCRGVSSGEVEGGGGSLDRCCRCLDWDFRCVVAIVLVLFGGYRTRRSRIPIEEVLDYFLLALMLISRAGSEDDWAGKCEGRFPNPFDAALQGSRLVEDVLADRFFTTWEVS